MNDAKGRAPQRKPGPREAATAHIDDPIVTRPSGDVAEAEPVCRPGLGAQAGYSSQETTSSVGLSPDRTLTTRHRDIEAEVFAAYLDGFAAGLHEANVRMSAAMDAALGGEHGYGFERYNQSPSGKESIRRMLRGLVGVS